MITSFEHTQAIGIIENTDKNLEKELATMEAIAELLKSLDQRAMNRVIRWLNAALYDLSHLK